jgi:NAD(P)-dependent dehydrogenase (short-subunit alcohol dehydrogenase family)
MSMDWAGRSVVVASIGVAFGDGNAAAIGGHAGAHCALDFARRGAHVLALDGDRNALDALAAAAAGTSLDVAQADLLDAEALAAAAAVWRARTGKVDALILCHAEMEEASFEESSCESWQRVVSFDLLGPVFAAKAFLPLLKAAGSSAIVHLGSIDGILGNPNYPSYSAAKGGIVPLTHVMAQDLGRYGIRVNNAARAFFVGPEFRATEAHDEVFRLTPLGRPGYPEELAALVRFLASNDASYVTGATVPIDGGRSGITPATIAAPR